MLLRLKEIGHSYVMPLATVPNTFIIVKNGTQTRSNGRVDFVLSGTHVELQWQNKMSYSWLCTLARPRCYIGTKAGVGGNWPLNFSLLIPVIDDLFGASSPFKRY